VGTLVFLKKDPDEVVTLQIRKPRLVVVNDINLVVTLPTDPTRKRT
jgi:hypothetical protein